MTTRTEVRTYKIRWIHDDCGGEFFPTGMMLTCHPPIYPHQCDKCGYIDDISYVTFPRFEHEEITP